MGGYAFIVGDCVSCCRLFTFHPHKVPSVRVKGVREPICATCMAAANLQREAMGLAPHPINQDAYEACPEEEL